MSMEITNVASHAACQPSCGTIPHRMKELAREIFLETLRRIELKSVLRSHIRRQGTRLDVFGETLDLSDYRQVFLIAFGKASVTMAAVLAEILAEDLANAVIVTNALPAEVPTVLIRHPIIIGGHPTPNEGSLEAGRRVIELLSRRDEQTLVFFLVSGGGSALVEVPLFETVTLADVQQLNRVLVTCGATIREINAVRKHLSAIKGGRLAQRAHPARQISLYVSDVNPGDLSTIASGPTVPDETTWDDVLAVVEKYEVRTKLPPRIADILSHAPRDETPKPGDPIFTRSTHHLVMDNRTALDAAATIASERGCLVEVDDSPNEEHYRIVADRLLARLLRFAHEFPDQTVCLVSGGEVSCPVTGSGVGGRNQEFVLYAAVKIADLSEPMDVAVLSAGTDGIDGISPAAGAVADRTTVARAEALGLDPKKFLANNDSYSFFAALGDAIVTGPTGTNVRDLRLLLARREEQEPKGKPPDEPGPR